MTEPPRAEARPTTRRRRWRALLALLLLLAAAGAALVGWWWNTRQALSDEERQLVGRWKYRWDNSPTDLGLEYEFRPDRTCRIRNYDPKTGALVCETTGATWRRSGDTLIVRHPEALARSYWRPLPSQRALEEVSTLTPDGPDRFRYQGALDPNPGQPPVTGTMTRVGPAE